MTAVRYTARYTPLTVAFFIVALLAALGGWFL